MQGLCLAMDRILKRGEAAGPSGHLGRLSPASSKRRCQASSYPERCAVIESRSAAPERRNRRPRQRNGSASAGNAAADKAEFRCGRHRGTQVAKFLGPLHSSCEKRSPITPATGRSNPIRGPESEAEGVAKGARAPQRQQRKTDDGRSRPVAHHRRLLEAKNGCRKGPLSL